MKSNSSNEKRARALRTLILAAVLAFTTDLARAQGPAPDGDGDGVADTADRCPGTRAGAALVGSRPIAPGCTPLDLTIQPETIDREAREAIRSLASQVREADASLGRFLDRLDSRLQTADSKARGGDLCAAEKIHDGVRLGLERTRRGNTSQMKRVVRSLSSPSRAAAAAAEEPEYMRMEDLYNGLRLSQALIDRATVRVTDAEEIFAAGCSAERGKLVARGRVVNVDDGARVVELDSGKKLKLPEHSNHLDDLFVDGVIQVTGVDFGDGTGAAANVDNVYPAPEVGLLPCLALRVVPIQPMAPFVGPPYVLHDPRGYEVPNNVPGGKPVLRLEGGMRLAVESRACGDGGVQPGSFHHYSAAITATFQHPFPANTRKQPVTVTLASDLGTGDEPVELSPLIDDYVSGILTVTIRRQLCTIGIGTVICSPPDTVDQQDLPFDLLTRTAFCRADYLQNEFALDESDPLAVATTFVKGLSTAPPVDSNNGAFLAEGYAADFGSSYPNVVPIAQNQPFAIYHFDFFDPSAPFAQELTGVDRRAGISWPRVVGTNNGYPYRYSCGVPKVVRDVVNFCNGVNAYAKLPILPGDVSWVQGQGNLPLDPNATHYGGYAYDMGAPLKQGIRATRSGTVVDLDDMYTLKIGDPGCETWCPPNQIFVEQDDGSIAQYVHMNKGGIFVQRDDVIKRGQLIAEVGMTGKTYGSHLHFANRTIARGGKTMLTLFEALDPDDLNHTLTCYEPKDGDPLRSNNYY